MATSRIDSNNAVGMKNTSSPAKATGVKRKQSTMGNGVQGASSNDAAVKVELSAEGKRLAAQVAAGADGGDMPGLKEASLSTPTERTPKLAGAEQELENLVQFYAKKIAKAARALDQKEASSQTATSPRKSGVDQVE